MVQLQLRLELKWHCNTILIWMKNDRTFIAFENGFHGDTFGAMSVSGLSVYNGPFEDFLMDVKRIPVPNEENHQEILNTVKSNSLRNTKLQVSFMNQLFKELLE